MSRYHAARGQGPVRIRRRSEAARPARRPDRCRPRARAGLDGPRPPGAAREVRRTGRPIAWAREGATSALFAVSGLFIGSYPRGHRRRSRLGLKTALSKPTYMSAADVRSAFLEFFRAHEPHRRALELARARQRPDAALHQRRHGAVQGRVPRARSSATTCARPPASAACAPAASTMTWRTSATPPATTPSSRCSATSPSATTSSARRSTSPGTSSSTPWGSTPRACGARCTATTTRRRTSG